MGLFGNYNKNNQISEINSLKQELAEIEEELSFSFKINEEEQDLLKELYIVCSDNWFETILRTSEYKPPIHPYVRENYAKLNSKGFDLFNKHLNGVIGAVKDAEESQLKLKKFLTNLYKLHDKERIQAKQMLDEVKTFIPLVKEASVAGGAYYLSRAKAKYRNLLSYRESNWGLTKADAALLLQGEKIMDDARVNYHGAVLELEEYVQTVDRVVSFKDELAFAERDFGILEKSEPLIKKILKQDKVKGLIERKLAKQK